MLAMLQCLGGTIAASSAVVVEVDRDPDRTFLVEASFDVVASPETAWTVLTDYDGIARFVSSIRKSTVKQRESGRVVLEQHGVGKAWVVSVPMHLVLEVLERDQRVLEFRDLSGKSFTVYEGRWEIAPTAGGTRVTYRLKADPAGRQPALLAGPAIKKSVRKLLDEVKDEIVARSARW
jgi:carbon monoxide dehydrogenase subunit G